MRKLLSSFSTISRISTVVNNQFHNPFIHHVPNRFYCVDPNQVPKPGYKINNQSHNPFIHYVPNQDPNQDQEPGYETVPYTKRTRFIRAPITFERDEVKKQFEEWKQAYEGKILPPTHPDSVRVTNILNNIVHGLNREVEKMRSDSKENSCEYTGLHYLWLRMRRRLPPSLSHLDGLNWEAFILSSPKSNCVAYSNGKIVVTTTFIEYYPSDVEIATFIAHQVAHIVARHPAEKFSKILSVYHVLNIVLNPFVTIDFTERVAPLVERLPFNRRIQMEADYIGLLLMASAGYDPRLTPKVYEKTTFATGVFASHPPGRKRAEALARPEIMEEALILYNDVSARHGVE